MLAQITLAAGNISPPGNFTFLHTGKLYPKSGLAHIIIPVDLQEIFEAAKKASTMIDNARNVPIFEAFYAGSDRTTSGAINRTRNYLELSIGDLEVELLNLAGIPKKRYRKEINLNLDIGNFVGNILNGVANLFNSREMTRIKNNQKHLVKKLQTQNKRIEDLVNEIEELERRVIFTLTETKWLAVTTRITQALDQAITMVKDTTQAVVDLNNGIVSTKILSLSKAKEAHGQMKQQLLESGLRMAYDDAIDLYSAQSSWMVENGHKLEIVIHCEVFDQDGRSGNLNLYQVPNLPMIVERNQTEVTVILDSEVAWVGISDGLDKERTYAEFKDFEFEDACREFAPKEFLCSEPIIMKKDISKSCVASLLLNKLSERCEFKRIDSMDARIVRLYSGAVYLFLPEKTEVAIVCKNGTETHFWSGVIRYSPQAGCRLETVSFTIPERVVAPSLAVEAVRSVPFPRNIFLGDRNLSFIEGRNKSVTMLVPDELAIEIDDIDIVQYGMIAFLFLCVLSIVVFLCVRSFQVAN